MESRKAQQRNNESVFLFRLHHGDHFWQGYVGWWRLGDGLLRLATQFGRFLVYPYLIELTCVDVRAYAPTIFERYSVTYQVTNYKVHCTIWDTSGTSSYDTVRPLAYPETHVFILCFTISDPTTLENIVTKWYPEVRRYCQTTPLILCGCQSDLRNDCETLSKLAEIQRIPVSAEQGVAVSRQIGATTYVETSSKTCPKAIQDAFEVSALAALGKLNKSLSSVQKFGSHRYNGTWHRAKVDLNFRDRSKNCVVM